MSLFGSVKGKAQQAQFEANKLLRINQIQRDINALRRQEQQTKFSLGSSAYDQFLKNELKDTALVSICDEIKKLEIDIDVKEKEIVEIRGEELFIEETVASGLPSISRPSFSVQGKLSNGHRLASPAAVFAILFFFMPWMFASCGTQAIGSFSGWDLASGTTMDTGFGAERMPGNPILFLILLSALVVLGLAYFAWQRGRTNKLDSFGLIGLGILPLALLYLALSGAREDAASEGILIEFMYGLWGTVISFIVVVIGGALNLRKPAPSETLPPEPDLPFEE